MNCCGCCLLLLLSSLQTWKVADTDGARFFGKMYNGTKADAALVTGKVYIGADTDDAHNATLRQTLQPSGVQTSNLVQISVEKRHAQSPGPLPDLGAEKILGQRPRRGDAREFYF